MVKPLPLWQTTQNSNAPILAHSSFDDTDDEFQVHTDASAVGVDVVLEQDDHIIAYARWELMTWNGSRAVIQRECLAVVCANKQLQHYLLGHSFWILSDYDHCSGFPHKDGGHAVMMGTG